MATRGRITLTYEEFNENLIPPYCMMTGERTDDTKSYRFFHLWWPIYLILVLPVCIPVFVFFAVPLYGSRRLTIPLVAEQHQFLPYRRMVFLFLQMTHCLTICVFQLFAFWFMTFMPIWLMVAACISSIVVHVLNVIFVLGYKLRVVHISDTTITFGGVHPTFIEMVRTTRGIRHREMGWSPSSKLE
jgi:hypothetical protein